MTLAVQEMNDLLFEILDVVSLHVPADVREGHL